MSRTNGFATQGWIATKGKAVTRSNRILTLMLCLCQSAKQLARLTPLARESSLKQGVRSPACATRGGTWN